MGLPNMVPLRRSRGPVASGDVFVARFDQIGYVPGKVLFQARESGTGPMPDALLLAFYEAQYSDLASIPSDPAGMPLLMAPVFTNKLGWTRGYFQTIDAPGLSDTEAPSQYWFLDAARNVYRNIEGLRQASSPGLSGSWGLASYLRIDDLLSDALGIPRAPKQ